MHSSLYLGVSFALLCAFATNLSYLYKHRGAVVAPRVDVGHPLASAAGLFRSRWFAIGWLVAAGAWGLHVLALDLAPISVVQIVLSSGLVLLAVTADRLFGFAVGRRHWAGLATMTVGLALIAITQPVVHGAHSSFSPAGMTAFEVGLLGLAALLIVGPRVLGAGAGRRGLALGTASGVLFGVSDVAIKALTGLLGTGGPLGLVSPWLLIALLASVSSFYASARGLQDGDAVPVIAVTSTAANVVGIAGGVVVFGDPLPTGTAGSVLQIVGLVLVVAAGALIPGPARGANVISPPRSRSRSRRRARRISWSRVPAAATFGTCRGRGTGGASGEVRR